MGNGESTVQWVGLLLCIDQPRLNPRYPRKIPQVLLEMLPKDSQEINTEHHSVYTQIPPKIYLEKNETFRKMATDAN